MKKILKILVIIFVIIASVHVFVSRKQAFAIQNVETSPTTTTTITPTPTPTPTCTCAGRCDCGCDSSGACSSGQSCVNGSCVSSPTPCTCAGRCDCGCDSSGACSSGQSCVNGSCVSSNSGGNSSSGGNSNSGNNTNFGGGLSSTPACVRTVTGHEYGCYDIPGTYCTPTCTYTYSTGYNDVVYDNDTKTAVDENGILHCISGIISMKEFTNKGNKVTINAEGAPSATLSQYIKSKDYFIGHELNKVTLPSNTSVSSSTSCYRYTSDCSGPSCGCNITRNVTADHGGAFCNDGVWHGNKNGDNGCDGKGIKFVVQTKVGNGEFVDRVAATFATQGAQGMEEKDNACDLEKTAPNQTNAQCKMGTNAIGVANKNNCTSSSNPSKYNNQKDDFNNAITHSTSINNDWYGYCLIHHNEGAAGTENPGSLGETNGTYKIYRSYDENFLTYGEAGEPGEYKSVIVNTFGDDANLIEIVAGRGGSHGVLASGQNGLDGSESYVKISNNGKENQIIALGGKGGKGFVPTKTYVLPAYKNCASDDEDCKKSLIKLSNDTEFLPGGNSGRFIEIVKSLVNNLLETLIRTADSDYKDLLRNLGKSGDGGYVEHSCWAGQWITELDGHLFESKSVYPGDTYLDKQKKSKNTPNGSIIVPSDCALQFDNKTAQSGFDGAVIIAW